MKNFTCKTCSDYIYCKDDIVKAKKQKNTKNKRKRKKK